MEKLNDKIRNRKTLIMGILNVTPDSFSDGGLYFDNLERAVQKALDMVKEGADIIDIGGESTRPGSEGVSVQEEIRRIIPVIQAFRKQVGDSYLLSVDTNKSEVAQEALKNGADLINSLGGFAFDKNLLSVVKQFTCPIIIYHIKGKPRTMQEGEIFYDDVIDEISRFFKEQIELGLDFGLQKEQFLLDPGIGFGKTVEQNLEIIRRFAEFTSLRLPLLIGVSRKSHIGAILQEMLALPTPPSLAERLEGSLAETAIAVSHGAKIVRTHDVLATKKFLAVLEKLI